MVDSFDKKDCCGCSVCANVCPKGCISMTADEEGFLYPEIDKIGCINCGLCVKRCPIVNKANFANGHSPLAYVVQSKDKEILRNSTSGGSFSIIANWIIEQGGSVFGAAFDNKMDVSHIKVERKDRLYKFQGSKYVQSNIGLSYKEAKNELDKGKYVGFSGTPCQIAGLKSYLKKNYPNLITIDVVCHGVPSPKFWRNYISYYENKYGAKIINASFRNKKYGYNRSTMQLNFDNGKSINRFTMDDYFLSAFFAEICSRPSCHHCAFKFIDRDSDFTIFDCWNATAFSEHMSKGGATNLFIHTDAGINIFESIKKHMVYEQIDYNRAVEQDGSMMVKSTVPNKNRTKFFEDLKLLSVDKLKDKYYPNSLSTIIKSRLRNLIIKCGLFNFIFN